VRKYILALILSSCLQTTAAFALPEGGGLVIIMALMRGREQPSFGFYCSTFDNDTTLSAQLYPESQKVRMYIRISEDGKACETVKNEETFLNQSPHLQAAISQAFSEINANSPYPEDTSFELLFNSPNFSKKSLMDRFLEIFSSKAYADSNVHTKIYLIIRQKIDGSYIETHRIEQQQF
jgi:hypothetical protein